MSAASAAAGATMEALGRHLDRLCPDTWKAVADRYLIPMANDPACSGAALAERLIRSEESGNPGTDVDVLLLAFAYCTEAEHACRAGRDADAWPLLLVAERLNGLLAGAAQVAAGRALTASSSIAELDARRDAMLRMRDEHKTDLEIAKAFGIKRQRVSQILGPKKPR